MSHVKKKKTQNGPLKTLVDTPKIDCRAKNVDFFQSPRYVDHNIIEGKGMS